MSVCQNVPRFLPEHDRKLGIPNERKQKETHSIHKKQKYFRWYPRRNHYLRLLWHGSHLRQSALASPLAFRHSKNPPATHWAIFVSQECSATLLRDISARKRCPSAPPRKITEKFRLLTSPRHRHPSFRRIVGALSNLQHIKIIQTYVSTLVNHHSMPQILSALGKMIGTTQNACLSLRPPSRLHWLDQPSKDDNAIHNLDSYLSPRLSSIPLHHEESFPRYAAKPSFYFQPRRHKPLAG